MSVFVPRPPFPDVPFAPGVPNVPRNPTAILAFPDALMTSDLYGTRPQFDGPQWGIFSDDGTPVLEPDSILAFDYREEYRVSDYPLEQGGFASYDKVALPFDLRFRMVVTTQETRADLLTALQKAAGSLDLFTAATPDIAYPSISIVHYDYRREARNGGVTMVVVDVWCIEVRETGTTQFNNTNQATSQNVTQGGGKQSTTSPPPDIKLPQQNPTTPSAGDSIDIKIPEQSYTTYGSNYRTPEEIFGGSPPETNLTPQQIYGGSPANTNMTPQQMYGGTKGIQ